MTRLSSTGYNRVELGVKHSQRLLEEARKLQMGGKDADWEFSRAFAVVVKSQLNQSPKM